MKKCSKFSLKLMYSYINVIKINELLSYERTMNELIIVFIEI